MNPLVLEKIYRGLKTQGRVNLTPFLREDVKEFVDQPNGREEQVIKLTMQYLKSADPQILVNVYRGRQLIENKFYYLDQKEQLKQLLNSYLNLDN